MSMKKLFVGAAVVAVALGAWQMLVPKPAAAQTPLTALYGPGSWIGVSARETTSEDAEKAKLAQPVGVVIESVQTGSPAAEAKLQAGDIVLDYDGERVRSVRHFTRLVQESAPRRAVDVVVVRGTGRQTLKVVPGFTGEFLRGSVSRNLDRLRERLPRNFNFNFDRDPSLLAPRGLARGGTLGLTLSPLSGQLADYFGVKEGALVSAVESGTAAAEAGVRAGDVITAIDGRDVRSAADAAAAIARVQPGGTIEMRVTRDKKSLTLKATVPARRTVSRRGGLPV